MQDGAAALTERDPSAGRVRVLYVMGAGRSGSTILGVTLGNCSGVFYAGELDAWLGAHGVPVEDDEELRAFWSEVAAGVDSGQELLGREAAHAIDRSMSLLRPSAWRTRRRLRQTYLRVAESLYGSVARVSGCATIVDTSHYPLRARELQRLEHIDLHILYLRRDPQSVVASFNNRDVAQYNKSTLTTNVYLWLTSLLAIAVFLRQPRERRLYVGYERFLAEPEAVLSDMLDQAGGGELPPDLGALRTGVAFQGNRLLRRGVLALERGPAPSPRRSSLTVVLQLPLTFALSRLEPRAGDGRATPPHARVAPPPSTGSASAGAE